MVILKLNSPNYSDRGATKIDTIIIHGTETTNAHNAMQWLCEEGSNVSAHYVIDKDGTIWNLVAEDKMAWHCRPYNRRSIGIELVHNGDEETPFPAAQIKSLSELVKDICERYSIQNILGHREIEPDRKHDPAKTFPWDLFR